MTDRNRPTTIDVLALGPPEVHGDGGPITLPPKLLAVLVYLAVGPPDRAVRRDAVLALFWPDLGRERARNALNQCLHQLRRHLGEGAVESRGKEELAAGVSVAVDVRRFDDRLEAGDREAALDLYRGEFLEGFHVSGAPGFERWLDGVRARVRRQARDACVELARMAADAGRRDESSDWLRCGQDIVPTDERVAASLVELLLRQGDRAGAVRAYRTFARRLEEELGMEPSVELRDRVAEARSAAIASDGPGLLVISVPPLERRVAAGLVDRAQVLVESDRPDNTVARELLRQAVDLDAGYAPAWRAGARATARWIRELGGSASQAPAAVAAARRGVELAPDDPDAHVALGLALEVAARPEDAAEALRAALRRDVTNAEPMVLLVRNLLYAGEFGQAARTARDAARTHGEQPRILGALAMSHKAVGVRHEGEEAFRRLWGDDGGSLFDRAGGLIFDLWRGREDRAASRVDELLAEDPDGFLPHFIRADVAMAAGCADAAIEHYERCYRMDPDSRGGIARSTRALLGGAHLKGGDPERGRALLAAAEMASVRSLAAGATWGGIHHDLALVHAARGETEAALHWLEQAYRVGWRLADQIRTEPGLRPLRTEERFRRVAAAAERDVAEQRARTTKGT